MTQSTAKVGCSTDGQVAGDEVTRYFARKNRTDQCEIKTSLFSHF
jgi:hypothetical protein